MLTTDHAEMYAQTYAHRCGFLTLEVFFGHAFLAGVKVEEKHSAYLEASRELKVMEKLKEKREKEYHEEVLAAETLERDDTWRPRAVEG